MPEEKKITNPTMGANDTREETSDKRGSTFVGSSDPQTQIAAISAQKKKEEEEALQQAKQKIDQAVQTKKLPDEPTDPVI